MRRPCSFWDITYDAGTGVGVVRKSRSQKTNRLAWPLVGMTVAVLVLAGRLWDARRENAELRAQRDDMRRVIVERDCGAVKEGNKP